MIILKNILILTGSAHKNGTSLLLADEFEKGAKDTGNNVKRYDTAFLSIGSCIGCNHCRNNNGDCIQKDDFGLIKNALFESDIIVFVTPLYYFDMPAQLKKVIDRFHSISSDLSKKQRGAILISTQASLSESTADVLKMHYHAIIDYLNWESLGMVIAKGVPSKESIECTDYPQMAKKLGENIK